MVHGAGETLPVWESEGLDSQLSRHLLHVVSLADGKAVNKVLAPFTAHVWLSQLRLSREFIICEGANSHLPLAVAYLFVPLYKSR